jgi:hypothetical protein
MMALFEDHATNLGRRIDTLSRLATALDSSMAELFDETKQG